MSPRTLTILGAAAVAGALGGWLWFGSGTELEPASAAPESRDRLAIPAPPASIQPNPTSPPQATSAIPPRPQPAAAPPRIDSSVMPGMPLARTESKPPPAGAALPAMGPPPGGPQASEMRDGHADLEDVQMMFRNFRTRLGGNPVGTNAEIMKSIMGGNPAQARLGPPEGQSLNEQGELTDRWGTPYFFHQLSKTEMEVRSAGQDRLMWTTDDVVVK